MSHQSAVAKFINSPCLAGPIQRILLPSQNARPCRGLYCDVLEAYYWRLLVAYCKVVGDALEDFIGEKVVKYWRSLIGEVLLGKQMVLVFDCVLLETCCMGISWVIFQGNGLFCQSCH